MSSSPWRKIFLVVQTGADGKLDVVEREAHPIEGTDGWAVNMRNPTCRSKLIEVVSSHYIHDTRESAERKRDELFKKEKNDGGHRRG